MPTNKTIRMRKSSSSSRETSIVTDQMGNKNLAKNETGQSYQTGKKSPKGYSN